jgi:2-polyprenyl-6-hydroxyphenyl methylase/3-demethylubiquinone-9 3-methyltransferase
MNPSAAEGKLQLNNNSLKAESVELSEAGGSALDSSCDNRFYDYYAEASQSKETFQRFGSIRDMVLRIAGKTNSVLDKLDVADIGCGAGTQSIMWAELGHNVNGLDINEALIGLARKRAAEAGYSIEFAVGTAADLPWPNESMDICLVPELLEHVIEWDLCLNEFARVLKPKGILYISTTNKLCPIQQEFNLPLYSWYPERLRRRFERLSVSSRPELVNYATYPAVNWFCYYSLRAELARRGFTSMDRFDVINSSEKNPLQRSILWFIKSVPLLRLLGHIVTPYTNIVAIKRDPSNERHQE